MYVVNQGFGEIKSLFSIYIGFFKFYIRYVLILFFCYF